MARNKFALCCALRHIFFNDYNIERTSILSDILATSAYYTDKDTPSEIICNQKKLNLWLTRAELAKKLQPAECGNILDSMMRDLELINLHGMVQYVKEKADAAGDLAMTHIKGDNDKW